MEIDEKSPSKLNSDPIDSVVDLNILDSSKKRKLLADELDSPLLKRFCLQQAFVVGPCHPSDRFLGKAPETGCGTSITCSFSGDRDFAECSSYSSNSRKTPSVDSSSVSIAGGSYMFGDSSYSIGGTISTTQETECNDFTSSSGDHHSFEYCDKTQLAEDQNQLEFIPPEFGVEDLEQLDDAEIQDFFHSQDVDGGSLLLSSGRWNITNQDAREDTRTPTIDQEFEQYFSALMM